MIFKKSKWLKLMIIVLSSLPIIGCITISSFVDMNQDGSGQGVIYQTLTFPDTSKTENSNANFIDSYIQKLVDEGWENIEISSPGNEVIQVSSTYTLDLQAGRKFPESMKAMTLRIEDGNLGEKKFIFDGTYDYSKFKEFWQDVKNGKSIDLGPWLGGGQGQATQAEVDEFVRRYGEPVFEYKIRLAGDTPLEATGQWNNADDFLSGKTDTLIFSWNPNMAVTGTLHAVSQWEPEREVTEVPTPTTQVTNEPYVDGDKMGMPCSEFCLSLDPIGFWIEGEAYPNCKCDCGKGNTFTQLSCVTNSDLCSGEGMRLITDKDRPGVCMCTDPNKKFDLATRSCIDLDGSECNHGNGCEPEFGENCQNCSDCGCTFGSGENSQYSQWLTCNPGNPIADIYGCVFEMPDKSTQLETMKEEWNQCRDAWALLNFASGYGISGYQADVVSSITELPNVQIWQQKSGCIPTAGVILGREAVDPMVCLMRYCDRINIGIHELEQQIPKDAPVVHGPSIKVNAPDVYVDIGPLQVPILYGPGAVYGDSPISLQVNMGTGFVQSKYEIVSDPNIGYTIYLLEGSYTHTYFDADTKTAMQIKLNSGEMLITDLVGVPISKTNFDPESRSPWWNEMDYLVNCPEHSIQQGPDCYCNTGYMMDVELETCENINNEDNQLQNPNPSGSSFEKSGIRKFLRGLLFLCASFLIGLGVVIFIIIQKKN